MYKLATGGRELEEIFRDKLVKEIIKKTRILWALEHAMSLMGWDLETYMPRRAINDRSVAFEELSALQRRLVLDPELVKLVERAEENTSSMNDYEKGVVRVMSRAIRIATSLPEELVRREAKITSRATVVWAEAKKKNNYEEFKPYLEEIIDIVREKAEKLGYEKHPYDALLDLYEEGLRTRDVEEIFNELVPETRRILRSIEKRGFYQRRHELEGMKYDRDRASQLLKKLLDDLEWPWERGRLDVSPHPFTINMGIDDVRITVRYEGVDIKRAVYALIHEYGHALYELQIDPELRWTPLQGGASLGVHESQSRFWENVIGRSPWAMKWLKERIDSYLEYTSRFSIVEIYKYVNTVKPSLIRVDADEVTYNLHIYLRFTLEKMMLEEKISADELPVEWDNKMEELLGIRPKNYSEGVLQDIHWSHGSIGYFPTYTLGNLISAAIRNKIVEEEPGVLEELSTRKIKRWLREKIHKWGKVYEPKKLLENSLGYRLSPRPLIEYFEWKYIRLPDILGEELEAR